MKAAEQAIAMAESAGEFSAKHTFDHAVETALSEIESMVEGLVPAENSRWFAVKLFERDEKVLDSLSLAPKPQTPAGRHHIRAGKRKRMTMRKASSPMSAIPISQNWSGDVCRKENRHDYFG